MTGRGRRKRRASPAASGRVGGGEQWSEGPGNVAVVCAGGQASKLCSLVRLLGSS